MKPPAPWADLPFFGQEWPGIRNRLSGGDWLPGPDRVFAALDGLPPGKVRVVIVGQDPYPTPGHANGLAFSVTKETPLPRSLANIYKEMQADLGGRPVDGDLSHWAAQGVLLLNTALSVPPGQAGGHAGLGWGALARQAVEKAQSHRSIAFLLWGAHAQKALAGLPRDRDLTIATAHPSPLSARRGFFGSRPFSRINDWLAGRGESAINWIGTGGLSAPPQQG